MAVTPDMQLMCKYVSINNNVLGLIFRDNLLTSNRGTTHMAFLVLETSLFYVTYCLWSA